ncbi:MAG: hypothetical protein U5K00_16775 [Melioribacteraceae bacterium]|nr:hypothetical protein [Melioribacteraceae bacterium]
MIKFSLFTILLFVLFGCDGNNEKLSWLSSDKDSAYVQIERQFRGFDMAMKEVGYRYNELYFASHDENWDYAKYHLEKIETAINNGLERRPKRAASAQSFFDHSIPSLMNTIESKNKEAFVKQFEIFKQACNTCHINEDAEFVKVVIPQTRYSPVDASNSQE